MTTLVSPQLAASLHGRSRRVSGYADESLGRLFGNNNTPRPAPTPPAATRSAPVVIANLPTAPAAPGGFAAAIARRPAEPATPAPIIPIYVPPADAFRGVYNGDPTSVPDGEILSRTTAGRFVRTLPPPRVGVGGQHFGTTNAEDGATFRAALNAQLQRVFPGDTIAEHLGNPNRDTSITRTIGTVAAVATPIAAIVAPYAAPFTAAVAASANASASGGNVGSAGLTAALGTALATSAPSLLGTSNMNMNSLVPSSGVGGIASSLASSLGASGSWAGVFGNVANSILPGLLGGGSSAASPTPPAAPAPTVVVTPAAAHSNATPLLIGGGILLALLFLGGKRR